MKENCNLHRIRTHVATLFLFTCVQKIQFEGTDKILLMLRYKSITEHLTKKQPLNGEGKSS